MPLTDSEITNLNSAAMRNPIRVLAVALLTLICGFLFFVVYSPTTPSKSAFADDWTGLFVAVTKGFSGETYYLGSDDEWAYFRSGRLMPVYRKIGASRIRVPVVFPLAKDEAYLISRSNLVGYESH
jgi:hypothetical protein